MLCDIVSNVIVSSGVMTYHRSDVEPNVQCNVLYLACRKGADYLSYGLLCWVLGIQSRFEYLVYSTVYSCTVPSLHYSIYYTIVLKNFTQKLCVFT